MTAQVLTGGCFCGRVRYEITGQPFHSTICHCADCRKASAAPFVACFSVKRAGFRLTRGTPRAFASSAWGTRRFCPDCGTPLTFVHADWPDDIDVTTCSLDTPASVPPTDHVRTASQLCWIHLADDLPKHAGPRPPA